MSEWLLLKAKQAIFQLRHGENKLYFSATPWREQVIFRWDGDVHFILDKQADFKVLAPWNNSPRVDMSLHSQYIILILCQPV